MRRMLDQSPKRGEATVLVQDLDFTASHVAKQVDLKQQRPRGVFVLDIVEDLTPVIVSLEDFQILAVTAPHQFLYRGRRMMDEIGDPERSARTKTGANAGKH